MKRMMIVASMVIGTTGAACVADEELDEAEATGALTEPQALPPGVLPIPPNSSFNVVVGPPLCSLARERSSFNARRVAGRGHCEGQWYTVNPRDCRVSVHIGANWNEAGTCQVDIYEQPTTVQIFQDWNYQGTMQRLDAGFWDQGSLKVTELSSLKVPTFWRVTLYDQPGFAGNAVSYYGDTTFVGGFNDRTKSIRVTMLPGATN